MLQVLWWNVPTSIWPSGDLGQLSDKTKKNKKLKQLKTTLFSFVNLYANFQLMKRYRRHLLSHNDPVSVREMWLSPFSIWGCYVTEGLYWDWSFNSWGGWGVGEWFWIRISCKRLLEETNCMHHKWNRQNFLHCCKQEKKVLQVSPLEHHFNTWEYCYLV